LAGLIIEIFFINGQKVLDGGGPFPDIGICGKVGVYRHIGSQLQLRHDEPFTFYRTDEMAIDIHLIAPIQHEIQVNDLVKVYGSR
jgi:hypothetical protein